VAANQLLTDIARSNPAGMDALRAVPGLRNYQWKEFGPALLEVL
jgi:hypothetical protein